ncbi:MAG: antibiotic biosynthesis monooxygenase [Pseudohongiellaceae bacterium]
MSLIHALALAASIIVNYQLTVSSDRLDDFLLWIESGLEDSRTFPGNIRFDIYRDVNEDGKLLFVEEWESEAHRARYMEWRAARGDYEGMAEFMAVPPVESVYRLAGD